MYDNGNGVEQNYDQAIEWYLKAAEQSNITAQYNIGIIIFIIVKYCFNINRIHVSIWTWSWSRLHQSNRVVFKVS